jgi:hypothetical protein
VRRVASFKKSKPTLAGSFLFNMYYLQGMW